ncbi:MAG: MmcB family DNA repair protein [Hyphomicrobiaceae bacterium]
MHPENGDTFPLVDGRQSARARDIARGAQRALALRGLRAIPEVALPDGRRADLMGLDEAGNVWIVEIKSSLEDFRSDAKWPDYRAWCDRLLFAVAPGFPLEVLPEDTGLMLADRYGGEIVREAPEHRLAASRRKAVTLRLARVAAGRLMTLADPEAAYEPLPRA